MSFFFFLCVCEGWGEAFVLYYSKPYKMLSLNIFFSFQGNSNSLSTVDISAGYIGLEDYQPILIGLLMAVVTYVGPVYWIISLLVHLAKQANKQISR